MVSESLNPYLWSGIILFFGAVWAFFISMLKRFKLIYDRKRRREWEGRWKPLLKQASARGDGGSGGTDESLDVELSLESLLDSGGTDLSNAELEYLLSEWNRFMNRLDDEHHAPLIQLAEAVGLADYALEMASEDNYMIRRIEGLTALGFLNHEEAWTHAKQAAESDQPYLSIVGTRTLVRVNPEEGLPILLDEYASRETFPSSQALSMLQHAPVDLVTEELLDQFRRAEGDRKVRLAGLLEAGDPGVIRPEIHRILQRSDDTELLARLLHTLGEFGHPDDESLLIEFTDHSADPVRIQAVKSLGDLGSSQSAVPLTEALGDSNWWVRYRAAQSLVRIPDVSLDWLKNTREQHDDPYARDIMERVMVERNLV
jgi:hypothetical protein